MARLNISIEHGQPPEIAHVKFQAAIGEFESHFSSWIQKVERGDDGRSATISGSSFEVKCWYDERDVHVQGTIPLAWKLFEAPLRAHIKHDIERQLPSHHK